jgi:hypothetical protein
LAPVKQGNRCLQATAKKIWSPRRRWEYLSWRMVPRHSSMQIVVAVVKAMATMMISGER